MKDGRIEAGKTFLQSDDEAFHKFEASLDENAWKHALGEKRFEAAIDQFRTIDTKSNQYFTQILSLKPEVADKINAAITRISITHSKYEITKLQLAIHKALGDKKSWQPFMIMAREANQLSHTYGTNYGPTLQAYNAVNSEHRSAGVGVRI